MKVLQISSDRSERGILFPGTPAFERQEAYASAFGNLDIVGLSLKSDGAKLVDVGQLRIHPTNSASKLLWGLDALRIAKTLPRPDIVSVQDPFETGLVGWRIARRFGVPLHVQVHTDFLSPEYARLSLLNRFRVYVAGFVLRRAARIRVVSRRIKDSLEARSSKLEASVTVLPIFADTSRSSVSRSDLSVRFSRFKTKLLVVSRLEPEKNVALALGAFAEAAAADACLIIVGSGSQKNSLQHFAKRLNVGSRVFFEGARDSALYYALADLVLVPSKYEGYGLVIVEALAAGKPVLSTEVGVAREAGAIVAPPEKFVDALAAWFKGGPRAGELKNYPYQSFEEYVRAYCDDVSATDQASRAVS